MRERTMSNMKKLSIAVSAAWLALAGVVLVPLVRTSAGMDVADCPEGWYWDNYRQNCLPPGLPKDPPNGCLTGNGTHLNGTICVN